jgi:hypothetical protein
LLLNSETTTAIGSAYSNPLLSSSPASSSSSSNNNHNIQSQSSYTQPTSTSSRSLLRDREPSNSTTPLSSSLGTLNLGGLASNISSTSNTISTSLGNAALSDIAELSSALSLGPPSSPPSLAAQSSVAPPLPIKSNNNTVPLEVAAGASEPLTISEHAYISPQTLFIGDLSLYCAEKDLFDLFSKYGALLTVRLKRNHNQQKNLSYGFVKYYNQADAETAFKELNGFVFFGRALR